MNHELPPHLERLDHELMSAAQLAIERPVSAAQGYSPRYRQRRLRVAGGLTAAVACAAAAGVFVSGSGGPSLVERAAAAMTPSEQIVHLTLAISSEDRSSDGSWKSTSRGTTHEWTLARDGQIVRVRNFSSTGPLTKAPTIADSTYTRNASGAIMSTVWENGKLRRDRTAEVDMNDLSLTGNIRKAYAFGDLVEDGRDAQGNLRLRSKAQTCAEAKAGQTGSDGTSDGPAVTEISVNPQTYLPVRYESTLPCVQSGTRFVINVSSSIAQATPEALKELEIGDWPA